VRPRHLEPLFEHEDERRPTWTRAVDAVIVSVVDIVRDKVGRLEEQVHVGG
jgi:hypothetical protein